MFWTISSSLNFSSSPIQLFVSLQLLVWYSSWVWRYKVKKAPYSLEDASYLTRRSLGVPLDTWTNLGILLYLCLQLTNIWLKDWLYNVLIYQMNIRRKICCREGYGRSRILRTTMQKCVKNRSGEDRSTCHLPNTFVTIITFNVTKISEQTNQLHEESIIVWYKEPNLNLALYKLHHVWEWAWSTFDSQLCLIKFSKCYV